MLIYKKKLKNNHQPQSKLADGVDVLYINIQISKHTYIHILHVSSHVNLFVDLKIHMLFFWFRKLDYTVM